MGDTLKKVQSGQPLRIPASTFNTFVDAAREHQQQKQSQSGGRRPNPIKPGMVLIKNSSGADLDRLYVLGIDSPIISPSDNIDEFRRQVALSCVVPTTDDHQGKFVILVEPILEDAIGLGWISGVCPARVNIVDADHEYADVNDGDYSSLESCSDGAVQILWKDADTGVTRAIVRFDGVVGARGQEDQFHILNKTGATLKDGYACYAAATTSPRQFEVYQPDADSMLMAFPYSGVDLPVDAVGTIRIGHVMRFAVEVATAQNVGPGDFIGTQADSFYLGKNKFGFLVLTTEVNAYGAYAYVRYSGLPPVVKAVADPVGYTIDVKHCQSDGVPVGDAFELDIVPEG